MKLVSVFVNCRTVEATRVPDGSGKTPEIALPARRPLDLPRLVMQRAAVIAALGVLLALLLGLAGMRDDVDVELAGARTLAVLAERLAAVPTLPDAQALAALKAWRNSGEVRHLHVQVADAGGRALLADGPPARLNAPMRWLVAAGAALFPPAPPFSVAWPLSRPDGPAWTVTLTAAPESERVEALSSLLEDVALLAAVAVGMLVVMAWNTRHAFAPLSRLLDAIGRLETTDQHGGESRVHPLPAMPIAELETIAAALRHLDQSLAAAQQQRRRLAQQVLSLQEDERGRLARELHDEFGQHLTALRVNAAWLARRTADSAELQPVVHDMEAQCAAIQQDIRAVLTRLRPLGSQGMAHESPPQTESLAHLGHLLRELVASWQRSPSGTAFHASLRLLGSEGQTLDWDTLSDRVGLPRATVLGLYRISQEALTNVARHAGAVRADLRLSVTLPAHEGGLARSDWEVCDDGQGIADLDAAFHRGNGLAGLKERVWAMGADLRLNAAAPGTARPGCSLSATVWASTTNDDESHERHRKAA